MRFSSARFAMLGWLLAFPAWGDELADFNAAAEAAAAHQRAAVTYLHTGNIEGAGLEITGMRRAWSRVTALKRPAALNHDPQLYTTIMLAISTQLVGASIMIQSGRPDAARKSLEDISAQLEALRRANGIK
jgi:hypothetical protein